MCKDMIHEITLCIFVLVSAADDEVSVGLLDGPGRASGSVNTRLPGWSRSARSWRAGLAVLKTGEHITDTAQHRPGDVGKRRRFK